MTSPLKYLARWLRRSRTSAPRISSAALVGCLGERVDLREQLSTCARRRRRRTSWPRDALPSARPISGQACRESCARGSGNRVLRAADRRSRCAPAPASGVQRPQLGSAGAGRRCRRSRRTGLHRHPACASAWPFKHLRPDRAHVGQRSRAMAALRIAAPHRCPSASPWRAQRLQVADHHRRLVQVHGLDRQPGRRLRAGRRLRVNRRRRSVAAVQVAQFARVVRQVPHDHLILVGRMARQRPHDRDAAAFGREHARDVQERPAAWSRAGRVRSRRGPCGASRGRSRTAWAGLCESAAPARWWRARRTARRAPPRAAGRWRAPGVRA